jgi:phosphoribosylformylglycinamidine cyclo-ligase
MADAYKKAGVDMFAGDSLVEYLRKRSPAIGGFAGLFPLKAAGGDYSIVACTDGVGTKLKLAFLLDKHETVGIDLVAMSANDLIVCGATPLFFLDYYAVGKLELEKSKRIMDGILEGCRQGKMALLGGETAEMPGFYAKGEYDLAGFAVGIVKKSEIVDGSGIKPGDALVGLPSTGFHSNGYSLVRHIWKGKALERRAARLIRPTKIYVEEIRKLRAALAGRGDRILGMAHITGGGLIENVPRFLPPGCSAVIKKGSWRVPQLMRELAEDGKIPERTMWRTFNMGIGMVIAVKQKSAATALKALRGARLIGRIAAGENAVVLEAPNEKYRGVRIG